MEATATDIALDDAHQGSVSVFLAIGGDVYCSQWCAPRVDEAQHGDDDSRQFPGQA